MHLAGIAAAIQAQLERARQYIDAQGGLDGLRQRYGDDRTFAAPILTNCALAGLTPWREVPALPFELACLPHAHAALPAAAGGQLCRARPGGHRPGALLPPRAVEPAGLAVAAAERGTEPARARRHAAAQRRVPRSRAADELRGDEPGLHGPGAIMPVVRRGVAFLLSSVRDGRLLADRRQPGRLEYHAGHHGPGRRHRRRGRLGMRRLAAAGAAARGPSLHPARRRAAGDGATPPAPCPMPTTPRPPCWR